MTSSGKSAGVSVKIMPEHIFLYILIRLKLFNNNTKHHFKILHFDGLGVGGTMCPPLAVRSP